MTFVFSARRLAVALVAALALAIPAQAFAGYWSWGYNYIGASVNTTVGSGYNYWTDLYVDKNSGDRIYAGWALTSGSYCHNLLDGVTTWYAHPSSCGYGGYYLKNVLGWVYGNSSYTFADSVA